MILRKFEITLGNPLAKAWRQGVLPADSKNGFTLENECKHDPRSSESYACFKKNQADLNLRIKNFIDQRKITAEYELTNTSTVNILYRMYVVVEGVSDDVAGKLVSVKSSSTEIDLIPLVFRDGRACAVDTDPSKKIILNAPTTESKYTFTLIIDSKDVSVQGISTFKVKIINEAYQSDYEYSNDQTIKSGEAQLPSGIVTEDVTFSGTTSAAEGVQAFDAEVTFSANTLNKITDNGNTKVTLKTETLAPEGKIAKISLKLEGATTTDFFRR